MPGIVGFISRMPRERAERELRQMVESLRHESFYVTGTWVNESLGVYVGWIARKDSFSDGMPLRNERGDIVLVVFRRGVPGARDHPESRGHEATKSMRPDASYLAHLYEEDPAFPAGLNGRFHGLLTDEARGTATLFNDRYGMHRIYYHESKDAFYFAAEAKAILAVRPELRRADPTRAWRIRLLWRGAGEPNAVQGIQVLPPASAGHFETARWSRKAPIFTHENGKSRKH